MRHLNHSSEPMARVLSLVKDARPSGSGWTARCPAHDDRTPSLSITQGNDGRALLHCHAGCAFNAIVAALGIEERELFPSTDAAAVPSRSPRPPREFDSAAAGADAYRTTHGPEAAKWVYHDAEGKPIRLADLWPSDAEIDAVVAASVKPEQFRKVYDPMFAVRVETNTDKISPLYNWRPQSTYIRRPPYWEGALAGERTLKAMRPLAVLGDNITTDHLSPSNAILLDSAAGEYLAKMGLPEEDFNSYATHRGDHLTAQRATFANPKLINEMAVVDGQVQQGSLARVEPEGKVMRMWEAIETYMSRKQPLIIIAGADYGQGSSRDWAAKGVRLAGVEAIVAEGFERIHRTNLVGMGVLPLEFLPGTTRKTLGIDGTETFDVTGSRTPRAQLTLVIHRKDGSQVQVPVLCRLDTAEEVSIYEAGGVLQRFAQDFLESKAA
jgi:aconitate hydratase